MTAYTQQPEIQRAMFQKLKPFNNIDATLAALGCKGVYDWKNVPQNAEFDYITLGDGYELTDHTFDGYGYKYYAMVHVWSNQNNSENPQYMVSRLNEMFDKQTLHLDTMNNVSGLNQRTTNLLDQTGIIPIVHYAVQYLFYTVQ